ncbi:MAG: hypothetical protein LBD98_03220 [Endomicrobium sp.]|jgi:hypothetical protein|nr:hypothetical protein [Endomicrobium sp.]
MKDEQSKLGDKWLGKIRNARRYESLYRRQSYNAYKLYNKTYDDASLIFDKDLKFSDIERKSYSFSLHNNRANVYYANIETLISLILPTIPNINVLVRNTKEFVQDLDQKKLYDRLLSAVSSSAQYFIDKSLSKLNFKKFKLDYFITGRGILWVDYVKKEKDESLDIEYVSWLNFCCDPKLEWDEVRWVARRRFLSKAKLKALFPEVNFEDFRFDANPYTHLAEDDVFPELEYSYLATGENYAEIWELWDKENQERLILSSQSETKIISKFKLENIDEQYFFPTPEPPLLICNGIDMRPTSEVWNYIHEIKELSYIAIRREQLLRSLMLKGFTSSVNSDLIQKINNARDGEIVASVDYSPENPNVISYIDNRPKVEIMQVLSAEHDFLKNAIYEISGISDQMRNLSGTAENPDEQATATEVKTKAFFGTRRLQEKQNVVSNYMTRVYELLVYRICKVLDVETLKKITSIAMPDSNTENLEDLNNHKGQLQAAIQNIQQQIASLQSNQQQQQQQGGQQQYQDTDENVDTSGQQTNTSSDMSNISNSQQSAAFSQAQPDTSQQQPDMSQQQPQEEQNPQEAVQTPDQSQQAQGQPQEASDEQQQQPDTSQQQLMSLAQQLQANQVQLAQLESVIQQVSLQPTWTKVRRILRSDQVQFLIELQLDDQSSMLKNQQAQQQQLQNSNTILQMITQIMQMCMSSPQLVDVYTGILLSSLKSCGYSFVEQSMIEDYVLMLKQQIQQMQNTPPPPPPPPQPDAIKAQAIMIEAQAKAQKLQVEAQKIAQEMSQQQSTGQQQDDVQNKLQLEQMQITSRETLEREKMAHDEKMQQTKIEADTKRYKEKEESDYFKQKVKNTIEKGV